MVTVSAGIHEPRAGDCDPQHACAYPNRPALQGSEYSPRSSASGHSLIFSERPPAQSRDSSLDPRLGGGRFLATPLTGNLVITEGQASSLILACCMDATLVAHRACIFARMAAH